MARRTKVVEMVVRVRVPLDCSAAQARREVRTAINDECRYSLDSDEIRVASVRGQTRGA